MRRLGYTPVHRNLGLIPSVSVTENLDIGALASRPDRAINCRRGLARAADVFARFQLSLDPRAGVDSLSAVQQSLKCLVPASSDVEPAKDTAHPGVLALDDPTPFLPRAGVDRLFDSVRGFTTTGASVMLVSHDV